VIPIPERDGWCCMVPVLGQASVADHPRATAGQGTTKLAITGASRLHHGEDRLRPDPDSRYQLGPGKSVIATV
jgi:hypothetical protein